MGGECTDIVSIAQLPATSRVLFYESTLVGNGYSHCLDTGTDRDAWMSSIVEGTCSLDYCSGRSIARGSQLCEFKSF